MNRLEARTTPANVPDGTRHIDAAVRANILEYFANGNPENGSIKPKDWQTTEVALQQLKGVPGRFCSGNGSITFQTHPRQP